MVRLTMLLHALALWLLCAPAQAQPIPRLVLRREMSPEQVVSLVHDRLGTTISVSELVRANQVRNEGLPYDQRDMRYAVMAHDGHSRNDSRDPRRFNSAVARGLSAHIKFMPGFTLVVPPPSTPETVATAPVPPTGSIEQTVQPRAPPEVFPPVAPVHRSDTTAARPFHRQTAPFVPRPHESEDLWLIKFVLILGFSLFVLMSVMVWWRTNNSRRRSAPSRDPSATAPPDAPTDPSMEIFRSPEEGQRFKEKLAGALEVMNKRFSALGGEKEALVERNAFLEGQAEALVERNALLEEEARRVTEDKRSAVSDLEARLRDLRSSRITFSDGVVAQAQTFVTIEEMCRQAGYPELDLALVDLLLESSRAIAAAVRTMGLKAEAATRPQLFIEEVETAWHIEEALTEMTETRALRTRNEQLESAASTVAACVERVRRMNKTDPNASAVRSEYVAAIDALLRLLPSASRSGLSPLPTEEARALMTAAQDVSPVRADQSAVDHDRPTDSFFEDTTVVQPMPVAVATAASSSGAPQSSSGVRPVTSSDRGPDSEGSEDTTVVLPFASLVPAPVGPNATTGNPTLRGGEPFMVPPGGLMGRKPSARPPEPGPVPPPSTRPVAPEVSRARIKSTLRGSTPLHSTGESHPASPHFAVLDESLAATGGRRDGNE